MSDNITSRWAWANAERRIFEWFLTTLGGVENLEGYLADLPRTLPVHGSDARIWMFELQGGGEVVQHKAANKPWNAWRMNGLWTGFFQTRTVAQEVAGLIRDALPIDTGTVEGVDRLTILEEPALTRDTLELASDLDAGGLIGVWKLEYRMEAVFRNTEPGVYQ